MFQYTSDDAELAITEQAEVTDRHITFKRDADRLRASCVKRKNQQFKCAFVVNVRFGEQVIQGTDEIMYGWHVTKMEKHDCSNSFVPFTHQSAADQTMIRGQYDTNYVEGMSEQQVVQK